MDEPNDDKEMADKTNPAFERLQRKRRSSVSNFLVLFNKLNPVLFQILKPVEFNFEPDETLYDPRRASKRISFAKHIFCQEIQADGTAQVVLEPFKHVSTTEEASIDVKTDELSEIMSCDDMSIDPMNTTCHIDYNPDESESIAADTTLNAIEEASKEAFDITNNKVSDMHMCMSMVSGSRPSTHVGNVTMDLTTMDKTAALSFINGSISSNNSSDMELTKANLDKTFAAIPLNETNESRMSIDESLMAERSSFAVSEDGSIRVATISTHCSLKIDDKENETPAKVAVVDPIVTVVTVIDAKEAEPVSSIQESIVANDMSLDLMISAQHTTKNHTIANDTDMSVDKPSKSHDAIPEVTNFDNVTVDETPASSQDVPSNLAKSKTDTCGDENANHETSTVSDEDVVVSAHQSLTVHEQISIEVTEMAEQVSIVVEEQPNVSILVTDLTHHSLASPSPMKRSVLARPLTRHNRLAGMRKSLGLDLFYNLTARINQLEAEATQECINMSDNVSDMNLCSTTARSPTPPSTQEDPVTMEIDKTTDKSIDSNVNSINVACEMELTKANINKTIVVIPDVAQEEEVMDSSNVEESFSINKTKDVENVQVNEESLSATRVTASVAEHSKPMEITDFSMVSQSSDDSSGEEQEKEDEIEELPAEPSLPAAESGSSSNAGQATDFSFVSSSSEGSVNIRDIDATLFEKSFNVSVSEENSDDEPENSIYDFCRAAETTMCFSPEGELGFDLFRQV